MSRNQGAPFTLSKDELQNYSLQRAIAHLLSPENSRHAHLELAVSSRALMNGGTQQERGIFVPAAVLARDMTVSGSGGNLVATDLVGFIEILRPASITVSAGATVLSGLRGNVALPRMTAGATPFWVAENGSPTESTPAFDQVLLSPKTVGCFVDISRRLIQQSTPDVIKLVQRDLVANIGTAIDQVAINGSGASNQPRGVMNTSGIGSVAGGTNGAAPVFDHAVQLEASVAAAGAPLANMAYVTNTSVRSKLQRTQMFSGTNGVPVWQRAADGMSDRLNGRPAYVSSNVPNNLTKGTSVGVCSPIIYGDWTQLLIGLWGDGITLMVDPYTASTSGTVRLVALLDCDIAVRNMTTFACMFDALPA